ncbi:MAG: NADH-quinone oxidoreductase subunit L, partial [Ignavibacteria bacterium]|nr:NADH-quinone oxidoreductase subunit L [Ignavibacteria bacterium]
NPFNADSGWVLSKWIKTPASVVPEHARYSFMVPEKMQEAAVKTTEHITHSEVYTEALHHAHIPAVLLSLVLAGLGILLAFAFYQWKKIDVDSLTEKIKPLYTFSLNKWYFDEFYHKTFVAGLLGISNILAWFDTYIVDGIVNGTASVTRMVSRFSGVFDNYVVDGAVNLTATFSGLIGLAFRKLQTGKVQAYVVLAVFSLVLLLLFFVKI